MPELDPLTQWTARAEAAENAEASPAALDATYDDMVHLDLEYRELTDQTPTSYRTHLEKTYARLLKAAQRIEDALRVQKDSAKRNQAPAS